MSHRNLKYLHDNRIIYGRFPLTDIPTESNDIYDYYENGTYECYGLFRSKAKITTYKSLKWHFLVLQYLNTKQTLKEIKGVFKYIAAAKNNFVTFSMSEEALEKLVKEVFEADAERPPKNRIRKVIFKPNIILTLNEKLSVVGKLIGRSRKIVEEDIYQCMLDLNDNKQKITINKIAKLLKCSTRTVYRNMGNQLKLEKELLNKEL